MALHFLSKHCIIIGVVTSLASLMIMLTEISRMKYLFPNEDNLISFSTSFKVKIIGFFLLALLAVISSVLLIVGIVKKRHLLLAPWLVVAFLLSVASSSIVAYQFATMSHFRWDNVVVPFILIGVFLGIEIVFLHPIYQLFTEIRSGHGNPKASESNYAHNVQTTFNEVSPKSMV